MTETFDFDRGRQVTVYVPTNSPDFVVYSGDGPLAAGWGADLDDIAGLSAMIVAVHRSADEVQRLKEYSPAFDPERFAAHERFFVNEVRGWLRSRFGMETSVSRTAVFGVSASGELALALGLLHPDVYGTVLCASPGGGYRPPRVLPESLPAVYLTAGVDEPFFMKNARRWAGALRAAGAEVEFTRRARAHGGAFWREELPRMVTWAFRRRVPPALLPKPVARDR